jgi:hypothetical protein
VNDKHSHLIVNEKEEIARSLATVGRPGSRPHAFADAAADAAGILFIGPGN